jgi:hypothetical protein
VGVIEQLPRLQSVAASLQDLTDRITSTADDLVAAGDEASASDLYEVERAMRTAQRRLTRLLSDWR